MEISVHLEQRVYLLNEASLASCTGESTRFVGAEENMHLCTTEILDRHSPPADVLPPKLQSSKARLKGSQYPSQGKLPPPHSSENDSSKACPILAAAQKKFADQQQPAVPKSAASPLAKKPSTASGSLSPEMKNARDQCRLLKMNEAINASQQNQNAAAIGFDKSKLPEKELKKKSVTASDGLVIQKGNEENQAALANRKIPPKREKASVIDLTCADSSGYVTHTLCLKLLDTFYCLENIALSARS